MTTTPPHPLAARGGPYTSDELRQIVAYEGLWCLAPEDMAPTWDLIKDGLLEITCLHGVPVATWTGPLASVVRSKQDRPA